MDKTLKDWAKTFANPEEMSIPMKVLSVSLDLNVDGCEFLTSDQLLSRFGQNFGNLAFTYACSVLFQGDHTTLSTLPKSQKIDFQNYNFMMFPAANNLAKGNDLGWLADLIEQASMPTFIIGLGVQAQIGEKDVELSPGSIRFLSVVKRRRIPLGVRGSFTKDFLNRHGIDDVTVTGCPSMFINPDLKLGRTLESKFKDLRKSLNAVALNLEYFRLDATATQSIVEWGRRQGGSVIFQSDPKLVALLRGESFSDFENFTKYAGKYFLGKTDASILRSWFAQYCRLFIHAPSWIDYLRTVSFSTGTRFHGNMLALQAGTPALVLYHDQRTLEMSQTMGVPSMAWSSFDAQTFSKVTTSIQFDGSEFDAKRRSLAKATVELARRVGMQPRPSLIELASL